MKTCPSCNRLLVVPICYGKPGGDVLEASDAGLCILGGCMVDDKSPNWHCKACGFEWMDDRSEDQKSLATLKEVQGIVAAHLFPIFTGMVLAGTRGLDKHSIFEPNALTDYGRLKKLLNIDRGIGADGLEHMVMNCRKHAGLANSLVGALARRIAIIILEQGHNAGSPELGDLLFRAALTLAYASPLPQKNPVGSAFKEFEHDLRVSYMTFE